MLNNLKRGDKVITSGGLYGRIVEIEGDMLSLEVGNKIVVKVNRNYISALVSNRSTGQNKK